MRYGVGYKGSKSRIAKEIIDVLPSGERFIDLFGGGGAMSHCAALSGKYNKVIYSDINPSIYELCRNLFDGKYYNRTDIFEWVSRDIFNKDKDTNPIIKWCWSFGNDGLYYLYSKNDETQKEAIHKAIINEDYSNQFLELTNGIIPFTKNNIIERKSEWYCFYNKSLTYNIKNRMEAIERLIGLISIKPPLNRPVCINKSYLDYSYNKNDIIYCDPPYNNKRQDPYKGFDSLRFWNWARNIPCYISEYDAPDDFECVWEKKICILSTNNGNNNIATEKLFKSPACNKSTYKIPVQLSFGF